MPRKRILLLAVILLLCFWGTACGTVPSATQPDTQPEPILWPADLDGDDDAEIICVREDQLAENKPIVLEIYPTREDAISGENLIDATTTEMDTNFLGAVSYGVCSQAGRDYLLEYHAQMGPEVGEYEYTQMYLGEQGQLCIKDVASSVCWYDPIGQEGIAWDEADAIVRWMTKANDILNESRLLVTTDPGVMQAMYWSDGESVSPDIEKGYYVAHPEEQAIRYKERLPWVWGEPCCIWSSDGTSWSVTDRDWHKDSYEENEPLRTMLMDDSGKAMQDDSAQIEAVQSGEKLWSDIQPRFNVWYEMRYTGKDFLREGNQARSLTQNNRTYHLYKKEYHSVEDLYPIVEALFAPKMVENEKNRMTVSVHPEEDAVPTCYLKREDRLYWCKESEIPVEPDTNTAFCVGQQENRAILRMNTKEDLPDHMWVFYLQRVDDMWKIEKLDYLSRSEQIPVYPLYLENKTQMTLWSSQQIEQIHRALFEGYDQDYQRQRLSSYYNTSAQAELSTMYYHGILYGMPPVQEDLDWLAQNGHPEALTKEVVVVDKARLAEAASHGEQISLDVLDVYGKLDGWVQGNGKYYWIHEPGKPENYQILAGADVDWMDSVFYYVSDLGRRGIAVVRNQNDTYSIESNYSLPE